MSATGSWSTESPSFFPRAEVTRISRHPSQGAGKKIGGGAQARQAVLRSPVRFRCRCRWLSYHRGLSRISSVARNPAQVREEAFSWPQVYLSVVLTTLATLILELSLTRIFSVVFNYHFAFMAISIALFGLGAGGVFSYVIADWRGRLFSKLGWM